MVAAWRVANAARRVRNFGDNYSSHRTTIGSTDAARRAGRSMTSPELPKIFIGRPMMFGGNEQAVDLLDASRKDDIGRMRFQWTGVRK